MRHICPRHVQGDDVLPALRKYSSYSFSLLLVISFGLTLLLSFCRLLSIVVDIQLLPEGLRPAREGVELEKKAC